MTEEETPYPMQSLIKQFNEPQVHKRESAIRNLGSRKGYGSIVKPLLLKALDDELRVQSAALKSMKNFPEFAEEFYPLLLEFFELGEEQEHISGYAMESLIALDYHLEDIKNILLDTLRESPIEYKRQIAVAYLDRAYGIVKHSRNTHTNTSNKIILNPAKANGTTKGQSVDIKNIFRSVIREDKSKLIIQIAWKKFKSIATNEEIQEEAEAIKNEILFEVVFELLSKIQPNIQVNIQRIKELSDKGFYERAIRIFEKGKPEKYAYPVAVYEKTIMEMVRNKNFAGEYFELEQVFVRHTDENPVFKPVSSSKELICYFCGQPIDNTDEKCSSCHKEILKCSVCKLLITFGEETGKCSLCESIGHFAHFYEWVKMKGKCPNCMQNLPIEGIVPLSKAGK